MKPSLNEQLVYASCFVSYETALRKIVAIFVADTIMRQKLWQVVVASASLVQQLEITNSMVSFLKAVEHEPC